MIRGNLLPLSSHDLRSQIFVRSLERTFHAVGVGFCLTIVQLVKEGQVVCMNNYSLDSALLNLVPIIQPRLSSTFCYRFTFTCQTPTQFVLLLSCAVDGLIALQFLNILLYQFNMIMPVDSLVGNYYVRSVLIITCHEFVPKYLVVGTYVGRYWRKSCIVCVILIVVSGILYPLYSV